MYYYATLDHDDGLINLNADIRMFKTLTDAQRFLLHHAPEEATDIDVIPGEFGDAWIKTTHIEDFQSYGDHMSRLMVDPQVFGLPFKLSELRVKRPGNHPGKAGEYWITPKPPVMVAIYDLS